MANFYRRKFSEYLENGISAGAPDHVIEPLLQLETGLYQKPFLGIVSLVKFYRRLKADPEEQRRYGQTIEAASTDKDQWLMPLMLAVSMFQKVMVLSVPVVGSIQVLIDTMSVLSAKGVPQSDIRDILSAFNPFGGRAD